MKRLSLLACLLASALVLPASAPAAERPIVYVVVIDGLDGDKIEAGKAPFISSLLAGEGARATYFPGSRSVMPAETNPNHTAMMSGAFPGDSGIPANAFALYAPLRGEDTCLTTGPVDFTVLPSETSGESASCPQAQFTFEAIKRQGNPDRLASAAVFGKPKLGRIFAGDNFRRGQRDADYLWAPCSSGPDDDEYCGSVPTNPISGYAVDDDTVMDRVLATIDDGIAFRGSRTRPDLTFVNLHQVDSAGHATGPGAFYDQAIGLADAEISELVGEAAPARRMAADGADDRLRSLDGADPAADHAQRRACRRAASPRTPSWRSTTAAPTRSTSPTAAPVSGSRLLKRMRDGGARRVRRRGGLLPRAESRRRRSPPHDRGGAAGLELRRSAQRRPAGRLRARLPPSASPARARTRCPATTAAPRLATTSSPWSPAATSSARARSAEAIGSRSRSTSTSLRR